MTSRFALVSFGNAFLLESAVRPVFGKPVFSKIFGSHFPKTSPFVLPLLNMIFEL